MTPSGIVTLTTDFGTHDPYAGIMKGIIYCANPNAKIIVHLIRIHTLSQNEIDHFPAKSSTVEGKENAG